jgi:hypothetical protein
MIGLTIHSIVVESCDRNGITTDELTTDCRAAIQATTTMPFVIGVARVGPRSIL